MDGAMPGCKSVHAASAPHLGMPQGLPCLLKVPALSALHRSCGLQGQPRGMGHLSCVTSWV